MSRVDVYWEGTQGVNPHDGLICHTEDLEDDVDDIIRYFGKESLLIGQTKKYPHY
ncbi:MAG: hypothetical protein WC007_06460 [Pelobacteraceae bacterium]